MKNEKTPFLKKKFLIHAPPDLCLMTSDRNDAQKFFAHKIILMCLSPYFQKVIHYKNLNNKCDCKNDLEINSSENQTKSKVQSEVDRSTSNNASDENLKLCIQICKKANKKVEKNFIIIKLPGISDKTLNFIINYAYCGKIQINCDNVKDLFVACDMYNIPALLNLSADFLAQNLTFYNAIGIFQFAKDYNFLRLVNLARRFILRNYEKICEISEEFTQLLTIDELLSLLEQNLLYVNDEYFVFKSIIKWILFKEETRKALLSELMQRIRLALISNNRLENQILNHRLIKKDQKIQETVKEVIKLKKYLERWGKPNHRMLNTSIKKFLTPRYPLDLIFVFGGRVLDVEFILPESIVEVYDHRAERWRSIKSAEDPDGPRDHHQAVFVKSCIYIIGGHSGPFNVFNTCRKFNLVTKTWSEIAPMNEKRTFLSSAVLDDTIYAIGGFNGSWRVNTVEKYNIALNKWQLVRNMNERRSGAGASVLNKKIYVVGGFVHLTYLRCAEFYDPLTNVWTNISSMSRPRSNPSVVTLNGSIYAIGGLENQKLLSSAEKYDSATNSWTLLEAEMFEKKCSAAAVVLEDKIFVIGGWNGVVGLQTVEIWCSQTKRWYQGSKLQKRRTGCCATVASDLPNIKDYSIEEREKLVDERYRNANEREQQIV